MDIDLTRINLGGVNGREMVDALIPHTVADYVTPHFVPRLEIDPENVPEDPADRAMGKGYVNSSKTVGTVLTLPISAVAAVATVGITAAAAGIMAFALAAGVLGAIGGGIAGAVGGVLSRDLSARRGAVAGLSVTAMGIGIGAGLVVRGVSAIVTGGLKGATWAVGGVAHLAGRTGGLAAGSTVRARTRIEVPFKALAKRFERESKEAPAVETEGPASVSVVAPDVAPIVAAAAVDSGPAAETCAIPTDGGPAICAIDSSDSGGFDAPSTRRVLVAAASRSIVSARQAPAVRRPAMALDL